jgi:hypothetical protein
MKPRSNPANGLCLSATYDARRPASDLLRRELPPDFQPVLDEFFGNQAFQTQFKAFEGQPLAMQRFPARSGVS